MPASLRQPITTALAACVLSLAACGGGDDKKSGGGGGDSKAAEEPAAFAVTIAEEGNTTTITAPKSAKAGPVAIEVKNTGKKEHGVQLFRLDEGHGVEEGLKAGNAWGEAGKVPLPEWLHLAGGTASAKPGESATATALLEPGSYVAVDLESEGAPAFAEFDVTGEGGGELPSAAGTIAAKEYSFTSSGLKAGRNTVLFDNTGAEAHHVVGVGIVDGATLDDVKKFLATEKGKPPIDESRSFGTAVIDGGTKQVVDVDIAPGKYALLCFIPDRQGGPPHAAKGMVSELEVK